MLFITEMTSFNNKEIVKTIAHFYVKKNQHPSRKKLPQLMEYAKLTFSITYFTQAMTGVMY